MRSVRTLRPFRRGSLRLRHQRWRQRPGVPPVGGGHGMGVSLFPPRSFIAQGREASAGASSVGATSSALMEGRTLCGNALRRGRCGRLSGSGGRLHGGVDSKLGSSGPEFRLAHGWASPAVGRLSRRNKRRRAGQRVPRRRRRPSPSREERRLRPSGRGSLRRNRAWPGGAAGERQDPRQRLSVVNKQKNG